MFEKRKLLRSMVSTLRSDQPDQILGQQHQVIGVARARFKIEVLVKSFCLFIFGVNDEGPRTNGVGGVGGPEEGVLEESRTDPLP